jgi:hypothetical protein
MKTAAIQAWPTVPRVCPGGTVAIFAGGPSLTREDVDYCRDKVEAAICVNNSYQLAPWATALWGADARWWAWHKGAPSFPGLKYSLSRGAGKWPGVQVLRNAGARGLEDDPSAIRNGRNGAYQAVNLAVHFGAARIVLLGVDMKRGPKGEEHWHGDHPNHSRSPYGLFLVYFQTIVDPLKERGIDVVNCSPGSALTCFPRLPLREVLS